MLMQVFLSKKEIYEICALSNNDWNEKKITNDIVFDMTKIVHVSIQKSGFGQSEDSQLKYAAGSKVIINV